MARKNGAKTGKDAESPPAPYVPTDAEKAAVQRYQERVAVRRKFPELIAQADGSGVVQIASSHKDETTALALHLDALGLGSHHEFTSLLKGVCNFTTRDGAANANNITEAMALVVGLEPRSTTEAMLAVQMAAVHLATMDAARRMHTTARTVEALAINSKVLNNLTRTFAVQAETMKKLKGSGEQRVTVEHKHYHLAPGAISGDAQAVLGDVRGGGGQTKTEHQPHVRIPERETVRGSLEANGPAMPGPSYDGQEGVPLPWGEGGRPLGHR